MQQGELLSWATSLWKSACSGSLTALSTPYPSPVPPAVAIERLRAATETEHHAFWRCDLSLLDPDRVDPTRIHGHRQVTDLYLLDLAVANRGRFVTFDRAVPFDAVRNAEKSNLVVL